MGQSTNASLAPAPVDSDDSSPAWLIVARWLESPAHHDRRNPVVLARGLGLRALAIVLLCFAVYSPWIGAGFLDGGVARLAREAPIWRAPGGIIGAFTFARSHPLDSPLPLVQTLLWLQGPPAGLTLWYHFSSIALHATVAVLLWFLLRSLACSVGWLAAALFAVSPLAVPVVALLDHQGRLWAAVFALAGALVLYRSIGPEISPGTDAVFESDEKVSATKFHIIKQSALPAAGVILFIAATLCQPSTATAPIVVLILFAWKKRLSKETAGWLASAVLLAALGALVGLDPAMLHLLSRVSAVSAIALVGGLIVLAAVVFAIRNRIGAGAVVAIVCTLLLLPTAYGPPALPRLFGSHPLFIARGFQIYLLAIPACVIAAELLLRLTTKLANPTIRAELVLGSAATLLIGLGVATSRAVIPFQSTVQLLDRQARAHPHSQLARVHVAQWYLKKAKPGLAAIVLGELTQANCQSSEAALTQGDIQQSTGHYAVAKQWYQVAKRLNPGDPTPYDRLASLLLIEHHTADAISAYESAIERFPRGFELRNDYGLLWLSEHKIAKAAEQFRAAVRIEPRFVPAHINLASVLIAFGKLNDAATQLRMAMRLDPQNPDSFHNAGILLARLHQNREAEQMLLRAVQLKPNWPEARNDLGVVLAATGQYKQAEYEFQQAVTLDPGYESARRNLAVIQGKTDKIALPHP